MAEAMALWLGCMEALVFGRVKMIFASDLLEVVNDIRAAINPTALACFSPLNAFWQDIKIFVASFETVCFQHVPRSCNSLADLLAKCALQELGLTPPLFSSLME
uniref:RNase H type-1 domain-containing protein n=1 Tax=Nelumbo nucifera TaxID=4432 RepID=A0A822YJ29_NELNU|nr:TPA_asm: hypothetical protein HUJ06_030856 [Nelumbo nucifera]